MMDGRPAHETTMTTPRSLLLLLLSSPLLAQGGADWPTPFSPIPPLTLSSSQVEVGNERPDLHGPIGVRGDHPVSDGAWQFSYRYEREDFGGILNGRSELSKRDVYDQGYTRTPSGIPGLSECDNGKG